MTHKRPLAFILFFLVIGLIPSVLVQAIADNSDRHALVIGVGDYNHLPSLDNPVNDATAIASTLRELGFNVTLLTDVSRTEMLGGLAQFTSTLNKDSISLFYYAGHGIQHDGKNFLLPADADITESWELQDAAMSLDTAVEALKSTGSALRMFMLDACRDNPLKNNGSVSRTIGSSRGLAKIDATYGTIISYATEPGEVAYDGEDKHSPYTEALLRYLPTPNQSIPNILNTVGRYVLELTNFTQTPWWSSSPIPDFCFEGCGEVTTPSTLKQFVNSFSRAVEQKDLLQLSAFTNENPDTRQLFTPLFSEYEELKVRSVSDDLSSDFDSGEIELVIQEARTKEGTVVYPSTNWGQLTLTVKRNGDDWKITEINNGRTKDDVDFQSPQIVFAQNNPQLDPESRIRVVVNITDDSDISSTTLYYRATGSEPPFISVPLVTNDPKSGMYYSSLAIETTKGGGQLEVFAEATDASGNRTQYPGRNNPLNLNTNLIVPPIEKGKKRTLWLTVGLGVLAVGALIAGAAGGGSSSGDSAESSVTITTPLP